MGQSFHIPKPEVPKISEYKTGLVSDNLNNLKGLKPYFSFKYISMKKKDFCFNSKLVKGIKGYHSVFDGLKRISDITYGVLSTDKTFHFHIVNLSDTSIPEASICKMLGNIPSEQLPDIHQFKINKEVRMFGFLHSGIFYLLLLDANHRAYKRR